MSGLLLVEDEEAIRRKLANNVSWSEHGFAPVLEAGDGLEALAVLAQHEVEIMVTDIQMPRMNGIDLIKEVKQRGYRMKIVVISGFAEFEYAQESIKLHVADYLLKPFASKRLLEIVLHLREDLTREEAEEIEVHKLREKLGKSTAGLREKFFLDLLSGNLDGADLQAELAFLGLEDLADRACQAAVVEIPKSVMQKAANEEDKYFLHLKLHQQVQHLLSGGPYRHVVVNHHRGQMAILFFEPDHDLPMRLEELLTQLRLALNSSLACGVGHRYANLRDLHISYQEACLASQYRYLHGPDRVFSINDVNLDNPAYHKLFYSLYQNRIFDDLRIGAEQAVREDLRAMSEEMRQAGIDQETAGLVASNLILLSCATLNELGYSTGAVAGADLGILGKINRADSLTALEELLLGFFDRVNESIKSKRTSLNAQLVEEIRRQIDEHFATDLTLSGMAEQYKISPSYLSLLFSEQVGQNFIDYLTERRLKKARELLKHTDMKIYEIAAAVGYKDSYYFSSCFKKATGLSPSEYREGLA